MATLWFSLGAASLFSGFAVLGERPLSWLVADRRWGLLFSTGLAVAAFLLVLFHQHLRRRYRLDCWFSAAMLTGLAGQLVAAVVPIDASGAVARTHSVAALVLGASLPVLMWRFAVLQPPGRWRRANVLLFGAEATAALFGILLSRASVAAVGEILPAAFFHLWIVVVTFGNAGRCCRPGPAPTSDKETVSTTLIASSGAATAYQSARLHAASHTSKDASRVSSPCPAGVAR